MTVEENATAATQRVLWLDALRGIAVLLMIIFHFCYDLSYFGWLDADVSGPSGWKPFRYLIISMFILAMGISLYLANYRKVNWRKYSFRMLKLLSAAIFISLSSMVMFPQAWVYFGILHFMFVASLACMVFVKFPWFCLPVAACIFAVHLLDMLPFKWPFNYIIHWLYPGRATDFVPVVPWLAVALIGVFIGYIIHTRPQLARLGENRIPVYVSWAGKHSLLIYLMHQPVLFIILYPISKILN